MLLSNVNFAWINLFPFPKLHIQMLPSSPSYLLERSLYLLCHVGDNPGRVRDLRQQIHLQVGRERVREPHVPRVRRQDQVTHLDTVRRYDVAEGVVVVTEELREVVE